jgi:hypothetical protein
MAASKISPAQKKRIASLEYDVMNSRKSAYAKGKYKKEYADRHKDAKKKLENYKKHLSSPKGKQASKRGASGAGG